MSNGVRLLQMIVLSMVIALVFGWRTPRLNGQAQPSVALVVDDTGSTVDDLSSFQMGMSAKIAYLQTLPGPFPTTALITFKDDVQPAFVTNDPALLLQKVGSLVSLGGGDCPESSIAAMIAAANLLQDNGELDLYTDAASRPDGPDQDAIDSIIKLKSLHTSYTIKTDSLCVDVSATGEGSALESGRSANQGAAGQGPQSRDSQRWTAAALGTGAALGPQSPVETFSKLAIENNGIFVAISRASLLTDEGKTRYINLVANTFGRVSPTVPLVTPAAVPQGVTLRVELTGSYTNFQPSSAVSIAGSGVTVLSQEVISPTRMLVDVSVNGSAAPGFRDVTVTTNLGRGTIETARGVGSLQIMTPPPAATIVGITPSQVAQGTTTNVTITGTGSHFVNGSSTVGLGTGVTANRVTVSSPTALTANVTVTTAAAIGFHDVTVTTGTETATESVVGPLLVAAPPAVVPRVLTATPGSGSRGTRRSVTLTGENTHFGAATTVAFSGTGITVENVTVKSATSLTVIVTIAADAVLGFKNIVVTTGPEVAVLVGGFNTIAGTTHDLVVDFGPPSGIWLKAGRTGKWTPFSPLSSKSIVTGDLDGNGIDEVIVDFGAAKGIWVYANDSEWYQLRRATANRMVTGDLDGNGKAELIVDFPGRGISVFANNTSWHLLDARHSTNMVTGDLDGNGKAELIIDVPRFGIWVWLNNTSWFELRSINSRSIVVDDFAGNGRAEVIADFDKFGIFKYSLDSSWSRLFPFNASHLAAGDIDGNSKSDLIVDLGDPFGIWILLNGTRWTQLTSRASKGIITSDLDNTGKAEIIIDFGARGLWEYSEKSKLVQLSSLRPGVMAAGHIKEP